MKKSASQFAFWIITTLSFISTIILALVLIHHRRDRLLFGLITGCGAMGGILYATRDSSIENPHYEIKRPNFFSVGYFSDIIGGIGGAYIIFLLLPFDFNRSTEAVPEPSSYLVEFGLIRQLIRVMAISLIGGYGGRALMSKAHESLLGKVKGEVEELGKKSEILGGEVKALGQTVEQQKKADQIKSQLQSMSAKILSDDVRKPSTQDIQSLKGLLKESSPDLRHTLFQQALQQRRQYAIDLIGMLPPVGESPGDTESNDHVKSLKKVCEKNKPKFHKIANKMYATEVIFDALYQTMPGNPDEDEKRRCHRYIAQRAYAKKDYLYATGNILGDAKWLDIKSDLTKAIEARNKESPESSAMWGDDENDNFGFYELNLAICMMELDPEFKSNKPTALSVRAQIHSLIEVATRECERRGSKSDAIYPINFWLKLNPGAAPAAV